MWGGEGGGVCCSSPPPFLLQVETQGLFHVWARDLLVLIIQGKYITPPYTLAFTAPITSRGKKEAGTESLGGRDGGRVR